MLPSQIADALYQRGYTAASNDQAYRRGQDYYLAWTRSDSDLPSLVLMRDGSVTHVAVQPHSTPRYCQVDLAHPRILDQLSALADALHQGRTQLDEPEGWAALLHETTNPE